MLDKRQFLKEEKDCASMLGLTLEEYRKSLKKIKSNKQLEKDMKNRKYDNSILKVLGLSDQDLKRRKVL